MTSSTSRRLALPPRALALALIALFVFVVLTFVAAIDARSGRGKLQRNVAVAGENIGRLPETEIDSFLDQLDGRYRTLQVSIAPPDNGFTLAGSDLGVTIDRTALRAELLSKGHGGGGFSRIGSYLGSFFGTSQVDVPVRVDVQAITEAVREADAAGSERPVDPQLTVKGDKFVIKPGKPGQGISPDAIAATLLAKLPSGPADQVISVERTVLPSRYSDAELSALLDRAVALTAKPLAVSVGEKSTTLTPKQLRTLVTPAIKGDDVTLTLDPENTIKAILKGTGKVGTPARDARLQVNDDGTVTAVPAQTGQVCCGEDAISRLNDALAAGAVTPVRLELKTVEPKVSTERIQALGVKELIGTFTTKHAPGEVRVKNIHRISDMLRGIVIQPGDTFSVNAEIGPRTAANGFFTAKVIEDGVYAENFGGGISQFATTMFNAAFFAGLDLVEYQSHSLYIKRYPYGREATLSFPDPDLKIRNNTPYGVLLWPVYTAKSITVNLYSTNYVKGEVTDQKVEDKDQCKVVYTYRLRTYVDGTTKKDRTRAFYRPAEGKDCKGNPTAGATTTTIKPKTTKGHD
jgi:vancomycin resistance protein YoaR